MVSSWMARYLPAGASGTLVVWVRLWGWRDTSFLNGARTMFRVCSHCSFDIAPRKSLEAWNQNSPYRRESTRSNVDAVASVDALSLSSTEKPVPSNAVNTNITANRLIRVSLAPCPTDVGIRRAL